MGWQKFRQCMANENFRWRGRVSDMMTTIPRTRKFDKFIGFFTFVESCLMAAKALLDLAILCILKYFQRFQRKKVFNLDVF
jgi:hypothetical protein